MSEEKNITTIDLKDLLVKSTVVWAFGLFICAILVRGFDWPMLSGIFAGASAISFGTAAILRDFMAREDE